MAYSKQTWQDLPDTTTPITANRLNHIEDGIEANDLNSVVVSATEPTTDRRKIWIQKGKNLFDINSAIYGTLSQNDGKTFTSSTSVLLSDWIEITPGATYVASNTSSTSTYRIFFYDENKDFIRTATSSSIFTDSNAKYVRIQAGEVVAQSSFMIELGSTATTYEAYIPHKIYILESNVYVPYNEENEKSIMTIRANASTEVASSGSNTIITGYVVLGAIIGSQLTFDSTNGIVIGAGVNHVKVSGAVMVGSLNSGDRFSGYVLKNSTQIINLTGYANGQFMGIAIPSIIADVVEGDVIKLAMRNFAAVRGTVQNGSTYLTVEVID